MLSREHQFPVKYFTRVCHEEDSPNVVIARSPCDEGEVVFVQYGSACLDGIACKYEITEDEESRFLVYHLNSQSSCPFRLLMLSLAKLCPTTLAQ